MQVQQYEALVNRLETQALDDYRRFRWKVIAYMVWGYFLMSFLYLLILGFAITFLLGRMIRLASRYFTFASTFGKGLWKGLWIKVKPTNDFQVERAGAEPLFQMIDEVCQKLGAPSIDSVYLDAHCNAAAVQLPRFGPLGPFRNVIRIGLPLMATLDIEELRGVIAHEIGHIYKGHSRFGFRVSQISAAWDGALQESAKKGMNTSTVAKIVDRYSPWLSASSIVQSRMAEREANLAEAQVVGDLISCRISVALVLFSPKTAQAWKRVTRGSFDLDQALPNFATLLYANLQEPIELQAAEEQLARALQQPDDPFSTHPNLTRLLEARNIKPTMDKALELAATVQSARENAAQTLFRGNLNSFLAKIDAHWQKQYGKSWAKQRQKHWETEGKVADLLATAREKPTTPQERVELAGQLFNLDRSEEALKWLAGQEDRDPSTRFLHALLLKDLDNPDWIDAMERVVPEVQYEVAASEHLIGHYTQLGDRPAVQRLYGVLQEVSKSQEQAALHYNVLTGPWVYNNCVWSQERLANLSDVLAQHRDVAKAYLVERAMPGGRNRHTMIVVQRKLISIKDNRTLVNKIAADKRITGTIVYAIDKVPAAVSTIPGALVYEAQKKPLLKSA